MIRQIFAETYRRNAKREKLRPSPYQQSLSWILKSCERNLKIRYTTDIKCERIQIRFPRTKRKRTHKKWKNRSDNWHTFYYPRIEDETLFLHQDQKPIQDCGYFNSSPTLEMWTKPNKK